ncbi:peptide deformylase [Acidobacteria bacterium ACD]|nr:MAG: peptide deformylase [Acidobacteriota bacterium]MDL1951502.1 peptide deformylase [Acidobacteria bacterium ACD]
MAVREILKYGDPRLLQRNEPVVAFDDPALPLLVRDLLDSCWAAPGYGLAAPQIGVNRRVAVVDLSVGKDPSQVLVLVNPVVAEVEGAVRDEEGCLSLPDVVEVVERPEQVWLEAFDEKGEKRTLRGSDLLARAFCHEVDHLDSRLFIDRLSSLKRSLVLRKVVRRQRRGAW